MGIRMTEQEARQLGIIEQEQERDEIGDEIREQKLRKARAEAQIAEFKAMREREKAERERERERERKRQSGGVYRFYSTIIVSLSILCGISLVFLVAILNN